MIAGGIVACAQELPAPSSKSQTKMSDDRSFAEEMIFDRNLREFAQRVGIIVGLEQGEKLTPEEAYQRIRELWKQLKRSKRHLIDGEP